MDKLKALFGLLMTLGSTLLVVFKWFTMEQKEDDQDENETRDKDSKKVTEPPEDGKSAKKPKPEAILSKLGEATDHIKKLSQ
jgi:hypothetical protein